MNKYAHYLELFAWSASGAIVSVIAYVCSDNGWILAAGICLGLLNRLGYFEGKRVERQARR